MTLLPLSGAESSGDPVPGSTYVDYYLQVKDKGGRAGNSEGRGNSQGAGNSLGILPELVKAMNASDTARMHATAESAEILVIPDS